MTIYGLFDKLEDKVLVLEKRIAELERMIEDMKKPTEDSSKVGNYSLPWDVT